MKPTGKIVSRSAITRVVERSTRASATLERRTIPEQYVRTTGVEKFLEQREPRR